MEGFEVEHDFPDLARKTMLLDARKVLYEASSKSTIQLAFTDITARRAIGSLSARPGSNWRMPIGG